MVFALLLLPLSVFLCLSTRVEAQTEDPFSIRVESNIVLVRVEVYRKDLLNTDSSADLQCVQADSLVFFKLPRTEPFIPKDCKSDQVIHGLGIEDFHVFEDGLEQKIQTVRFEHDEGIYPRDNLGFHYEWSHTPRGKWSTSDLGRGWYPTPESNFYRLSYAPPRPQDGKCHAIKVTVNNPHAVVFANDQYCYIKHSASDPLGGTNFDKQLQTDLSLDTEGKIPLSLQASFFYTGTHSARVDIVFDFSWDVLKHTWTGQDLHGTIAVLGTVRGPNRTIAARFSDFACCPSQSHWYAWNTYEDDKGKLPTRYESQIELSPGAEYQLQVVLSDGSKFGRAETSLAIDSYDGTQLAISSVVLCNRFRDAGAAAQEAAEANLAPQYVPLVSKRTQVTPSTQTRFARKDVLIAYFEIYEPVPFQRPNAEVLAQVGILDAKTGETMVRFSPLEATSYKRPGNTAFAFAGDLPIAKLPKGDYFVEVEASDSTGHRAIRRGGTFTIK